MLIELMNDLNNNHGKDVTFFFKTPYTTIKSRGKIEDIYTVNDLVKVVLDENENNFITIDTSHFIKYEKGILYDFKDYAAVEIAF